MPRFEEKYIHCVWNEELKGKKVFFADYMGDLKSRVENNNQLYFGNVINTYDENLPFKMEGSGYFSSCYWDPYYRLKIAREQGKTVQTFLESEQEWVEYLGECFPGDPNLYRIKEEKPVTERELAEWLSKGNGEFKIDDVHRCCYGYWYNEDEENEPVSSKILVRKWGDVEWISPTREYLELSDIS